MATIGDTSARSTNTVYYDALLSSTLAAYKKTMADNIFKDSAFLAYLKLVGAIDFQNGGERMALPLMYGDNQTVGTHGPYEVIDTTPQEGMTTAFFEWAEIAGSISISRKEERQNNGEGRIINLLEQKIKQAEMTIREYVNKSLVCGDVSSSTFVPFQSLGGVGGLNPLGYFLRKAPATDPVRGGNVGNISATSYSWWKPVCADATTSSTPSGGTFGLAVTTWKGLQVALKRTYNYCSRGSGGAPDMVLFDQGSFEAYESGLDDKVRYQNTKMADMGFDNIKLRGATCVWDEQTPDVYTGTAAIVKGTAFFLNTDFYRLVIDKETDFTTTPFVEPENQTVKTAKILFMGQAGVSNARKNGVLWGILQTMVA